MRRLRLSRLAKMTFSSYHADDVSGVGAMYSSLGPASSKKRDLVKPGVSRVFVKQLVIRLGKLLDHIVVGTMPHVATGKAHKVSGTRLWPAGRLVLPPRVLMVDRNVTFYADVLVNAMHVMMKAGSPGAWDHELVAGLAAGAPRLSRKKLAARTEMVGFLDKKKRKWRKAAADARGSGKRRWHLGVVRSGEPIGMRHPCSFSPLLTSPFTVQSVVAAAAVGPALGCVASVGEVSADDADSVTDADGASQDEIQSQDSRSVAVRGVRRPGRAPVDRGRTRMALRGPIAIAVGTSQRDCKPHVHCSGCTLRHLLPFASASLGRAPARNPPHSQVSWCLLTGGPAEPILCCVCTCIRE